MKNPSTCEVILNVLIPCEFSGTVRDEFAKLGHNAWSCDLLPSEKPGQHYTGRIQEFFYSSLIEWDIVIAFPPCTHLAVSGARWFKNKKKEQEKAIKFFMYIATLPVQKICIENPVSIMSTKWRKPDQIIQPWQFGHGETKKTCLWIKGLPLLKPTNIVSGREARIHKMPPSENRWKERSRTYQGIAKAMAQQWSV